MLKKAKNRLLTRAAQNRECVFADVYRAATVRESVADGIFQQPAKSATGVSERVQHYAIGQLHFSATHARRSVFRPRPGARHFVATLQGLLVPTHALQRIRAVDLDHPMLHRAIRAQDIQENVRVRIRPVKPSHIARCRGRMLQVVLCRGMVSEQRRRDQQDRK